MKTTLATTAIGATLLPTTLLTLLIVSLTRNPYLLIFILVQPIIGISMLISSAVMRYNSRMAMRQAADSILRGYARGSTPQGNWYHSSPAYQQQYRQPAGPHRQPNQSYSPPARSSTIPDSAFLRDFSASASVASAAETRDSSAPLIDERPTATPSPNGKSSNAAAKFCGACGNEMPDIADLKFCPACGQKRD